MVAEGTGAGAASAEAAVASQLAVEGMPVPHRQVAPPAVTAVQRHASDEHQFLGDTKPQDVKEAKLKYPYGSEAWRHLVEAEFDRVTAFQKDPGFDPRTEFPYMRWVRLKGSKLWVSPGELSAFGDYLPDPKTIDSSSRELIEPVLQRMRQEITRSLAAKLGWGASSWEGVTDPRNNDDEAYGDYEQSQRLSSFKGAAGTAKSHDVLPASARQLEDLDAATASLGPNRQKGLTARNACHFAPFSWERWALYHNQARHEAELAHAEHKDKLTSLSMRQPARGMSEHERLAWVNNGYSNHFLQDSFAAGHLINKTLVMQWFLDYIKELGPLSRPLFGLPDQVVMDRMTTAAQPRIAGRHLYTDHRLDKRDEEDRAEGMGEADPQTTLERHSGQGRIKGSGVAEGEMDYEAYSAFLNNTFLQLSANDLHDELNKDGLQVVNGNGQKFVVGGDGTLFAEDGSSIEITLEADSMADQAITDTLATGHTTIQPEHIFTYFPTKVIPDGKSEPVPLEQWHDSFLKEFCRTKIFPGVVSSLSYAAVRAFGAKMVDAPNDRVGGGLMSPPGSGDWGPPPR